MRFELTDAVLCADGPVTSLVELPPDGRTPGASAGRCTTRLTRAHPARIRRSFHNIRARTVPDASANDIGSVAMPAFGVDGLSPGRARGR
jgi:hypothetical protein